MKNTITTTIEKLLSDNHISNDLVYVKDFGDSIYSVEIDISNGDWKHDHLATKFTMLNYCNDNYYMLLNTSIDITEEDGSDCYSAIHKYLISTK